MKSTIVKTKFLWLCLLAFLVLEGGTSRVCAQDTAKVNNARYEVLGTKVVVHYDLVGPVDGTYRVKVSLRKERDQSFLYLPRLVSGDDGEVKSSGKKQIDWDFLSEFPGGLEGEDFYFVVEAELVPSKSTLWYWVAGGAVLVGGAAAILLSKGSTTATTQDNGFALPVGRPIGQ
jgi:hypothetical protein